MRILLLGANGQVGHELQRALAPLGEIVATTRDGGPVASGIALAADLARPDTLPDLVRRVEPTLVVNAGAYTAVDRAEDEPELAMRVNAEAPAALAGACAGLGIPLVHYSTDYVFAGDGTRPYREDDPTGPLGAYGRSKLAGEVAVRESGARHKIFRLCWVYAPRGRNFLLTMLRLAGERDVLRVVADQTGSPTPAAWIADATAAAIAARPDRDGTWHLAASGQTTWHGFASAIVTRAAECGLIASAPRVEPISSDQFPTPARRPSYSVLDTSALAADFGIRLPDWNEGVEATLHAARN